MSIHHTCFNQRKNKEESTLGLEKDLFYSKNQPGTFLLSDKILSLDQSCLESVKTQEGESFFGRGKQ